MKFYFTVLLSVLLIACKNHDIDKIAQFPTDLSMVKVNKKSGIRLFINKIEVKDQAVIDEFVAGQQNFGVSSQSIVSSEKIRFLSPDTASIDNIAEKLAVIKTGTQFLFTSVNPAYLTLEYARLIDNMNKHRSELGLPRYDGKYVVNRIVAGYGNYSEIEIPVFNYKLVKAYTVEDYYGWGEYLFRSVNSGKVFNEFDMTYINSLTKTDTLAVEEYSYTFQAK